MSNDVQLTTVGLDGLFKALTSQVTSAKVGILGSKTIRPEEGATTNAEVGASHEYGTSKLPQRSFLRMPLNENLQFYLEKSGQFDNQTLKEVLKNRDLVPWVKKIAVIAENVVQDAFDSQGFGKWPASDMTNKKNHQTLIETQQLRNSITSEVEA